jgi:hypothetical protein
MPQINATSMAPITAVQFGANRLYEDMAKKLKGRVMLLRFQRAQISAREWIMTFYTVAARHVHVKCVNRPICMLRRRTRAV